MFTITPDAAREVLAAAERSEATGLALRVAARRAADGSLDYGMGFDDGDGDPADATVEVEGLTVRVAPMSAGLLDGTVLDFVELEPGRFDFIFIPPAEPTGCGSGGCSACSS